MNKQEFLKYLSNTGRFDNKDMDVVCNILNGADNLPQEERYKYFKLHFAGFISDDILKEVCY